MPRYLHCMKRGLVPASVDRASLQQERATLQSHAYDADPELSWTVPTAPDLPYEGDIPAEVIALAEARHPDA